jgi:transcriptional regulator with XRE-family HTH domain
MVGRGELQPSGFGARLKAIREGKGWTQKQLGEGADVHANTIAKLERSEQEPNWPLVLKLAAALGVDCTAFSGGDDVTPDDPATEKKPARKKPKKGKGQ